MRESILQQELPGLAPLLSPSKPQCQGFHTHINGMQQMLAQVLPHHFSTNGRPIALEALLHELPYVAYTDLDPVSKTVSLIFVCESGNSIEINQFFLDMINAWILPGSQVRILASRNGDITSPRFPQQTFFAVEALVQLGQDKEIFAFKNQWPSFAQEVRLGAVSSSYARHILMTRGLSNDQKTHLIHQRVVNWMKRHPKDLEPNIFRTIHHFLLACDDEFKQLHDVLHMARIICLHYLFRKAIRREVGVFPQQRHLYMRLVQTSLRFPFGTKNVLGIVISLNIVKDGELFEERHIAKAVQHIFPEADVVSHSFFSFQERGEAIRSIYLEIEKQDRTPFDLKEIKLLKAMLPDELRGSIEQLSRTIFMPRNEEEVFRHIMTLSRELKYVRDIPQVIISFHEQTEVSLLFNVVLVRILAPDTPAIETLFNASDSGLFFIPDQVKVLGHMRRKYAKEANVFALKLNKEPFLRKDHSVDLYKAREFVVSTLEQMLGEFRDYNGGLILKQNQSLTAVKSLLDHTTAKQEFLLENLFYSLTPATMQSVLHSLQIKNLFLMFLSAFKHEAVKKDSYLMLSRAHEDYALMIVRAEDPSYITSLTSAIDGLHIDSFDLATAEINVYGSSYVGYIYKTSKRSEWGRFLSEAEQAMANWSREKQSVQHLRISLPRIASSLDPRIGSDHYTGIVINMMYEGLMRLGPHGYPEAAVAREVHVSDDGMTYTFLLRNTYWSNGLPLTAYDFEYAWKKILDPHFKNDCDYLFHPIRNAYSIKKNELPMESLGVHARDEYTLIVHLEYPIPYFLDLTAHWIFSPLCRDVDQTDPDWSHYGGEAYVCNGPFRPIFWKRNQELRLIKNSSYWDAQTVRLQSINVSILEDPQKALALYEGDHLDCIGDPLAPISMQLRQQYRDQMCYNPLAALFCLDFSFDSVPFRNKKFRLAFSLAIRR